MSILLRKNSDIYSADHGWLRSRFYFSFAEYFDRDAIHFGLLRVLNDDIIQGENGFPHHPHENMEIVTIMREGELTHTDDLGNKATLRPGIVQRMSAGEGVLHSEWNYGKDPAVLYQMWFLPQEEGAEPSYEEKKVNISEKEGLTLLVSPDGREGSVSIGTAAEVASLFVTGESWTLTLSEGEFLHLTFTKGGGTINCERFEEGGDARIKDEKEVHIVRDPSVPQLQILVTRSWY